MKNKEFSKVDWINIVILKNFQDYFNLKELQDLSMVSKLTRSKLKSFFFKSIILFYFTNQDSDVIIEGYNVRSFQELSRIAVNDEDEIEKNSYIKKSLSNINSELQNIKHFVNSIGIYDTQHSGCYLYPIISNFANLSLLTIHYSTIQYSIFQKLGEYFPMLEAFELYYVVLSKYSTGSDNSNEIIFPLNLKSISIWCVDVKEQSRLYEPHIAVFNGFSYDDRSGYSFPNIYLTSLKKLQFLRCADKDNGFEDFLETNPNLEELGIDILSSSMSKNFKSLKSLHLEQIDKFENLENLIVHYNIKALKIIFKDDEKYENLEKLCLMCPLVEFLALSIDNYGTYQEGFDCYLVPILKKLPNLKTLELQIEVGNEDIELIDINQFPQIEKIMFVIEDLSLYRILFERNCNLKEIEFSATKNNINKEEFLENYGSYTEWEFKFYNEKLKGIRYSIK